MNLKIFLHVKISANLKGKLQKENTFVPYIKGYRSQNNLSPFSIYFKSIHFKV